MAGKNMGSNALRSFMYYDPADVVERLEMDRLGCRACKSHRVVFDRVLCGDVRNEVQQAGVPRIGCRCRWFDEK